MRLSQVAVAAGLLILTGGVNVAKADELADVKARGKLVCGTLGTAEPFSFQDPKTREIVGYDVDMCRKVAESLGVTLELKPMAVEARIPELTQGRVDVLAANLGWTKERAQQIDYSYSYFVSQQKMLVSADSGIATLEQLSGKRVSALKGSSSEQGVRRVIPTAEIVTFQDSASAFLAVVQGKVDGLCASELILVKLRKQAPASSPMSIVEKSVFVEPWGLGIRKGETAFKDQVNKVLTELDASGEAGKIFAKWFGPDTAYGMKVDFKIEEIKG
ncbi:ABC transporter substrate-binding protein [Bradyrhizobium sp. BR13661]|jgi:polar amino acid transport system substrate-binding protein|uniref:ABC transporter substrate-binding protein n=1 Tax=Bradyrhizobium sp. BR13661 TaxID=2940622 RepID=UPI002473E84C|nr:ABC transporter substrate-binding protein [Bradyrhizobium sp. BR13661]MDH6258942.1 polar amino acid transport system substrate-binding protein [Bradyrhizobium sp. BR13661]